MPEHIHLLITEPEIGDPSVVMKVLKQGFARRLNRRHRRKSAAQQALWSLPRLPVWQKRFHDFNVWSEQKRIEKLRYMHRNPVRRGLAEKPEQWKWSSFSSVLLRRKRPGAGKLSGVGAGGAATSGAKVWEVDSMSPTHSQKARMSGAPG
jgi:REP-associated tyrosine transposase